MPKYYPINEEAARRAKNANSFSDYVTGSATAAYREMVDRAYALGEQQKAGAAPKSACFPASACSNLLFASKPRRVSPRRAK